MPNQDIRDLIARSSHGGSAWCGKCDHPQDSHIRMAGENLCVGSGCFNHEFVPMSPEQWKARFG